MSLSITTWNVNSIRARLDHVLTYLADHDPDVLCLQETKVEDKLFPRVPFMELGYQVTIHGGKALCGVATMTKSKPQEVVAGFREGEPDRQPRVLDVLVDGVRIYNLYCPNGTELGSDAYDYKLAWFRRLRAELDASYEPSDPIVIVGDFNVAPDERDLWNPSEYEGRLLVSGPERAALQELQDFGLQDCFRRHVSEGGHYTWYDYRTNGFVRGEGLRIDHVYATAPMYARSERVVHDPEPRGWDTPSDHVPVTAYFS
jgi:exodeoxyribonuclease-3